MRRPEDVEILPAAQRFADGQGINLWELREGWATGVHLADWERQPFPKGWSAILADRADGGKLRLLCGPEEHLIADVRLV